MAKPAYTPKNLRDEIDNLRKNKNIQGWLGTLFTIESRNHPFAQNGQTFNQKTGALEGKATGSAFGKGQLIGTPDGTDLGSRGRREILARAGYSSTASNKDISNQEAAERIAISGLLGRGQNYGKKTLTGRQALQQIADGKVTQAAMDEHIGLSHEAFKTNNVSAEKANELFAHPEMQRLGTYDNYADTDKQHLDLARKSGDLFKGIMNGKGQKPSAPQINPPTSNGPINAVIKGAFGPQSNAAPDEVVYAGTPTSPEAWQANDSNWDLEQRMNSGNYDRTLMPGDPNYGKGQSTASLWLANMFGIGRDNPPAQAPGTFADMYAQGYSKDQASQMMTNKFMGKGYSEAPEGQAPDGLMNVGQNDNKYVDWLNNEKMQAQAGLNGQTHVNGWQGSNTANVVGQYVKQGFGQPDQPLSPFRNLQDTP